MDEPGYQPAIGWHRANTRRAFSFSDKGEKVAPAPVILVVEDDWLLRQALEQELAAAGWAVREAESGETALEILKSGAVVDLLVTDIRLGGAADGWDVAEAFRAANARLPVIYVSGNPQREARRVAGSVFMPKPCDPARLVETCRTLLQSRSGH